jgi:hypothetical protein
MISLADTLHPESVNLDLVAITAREAIQETAALLKGRLPVLDWDQLKTDFQSLRPALQKPRGPSRCAFRMHAPMRSAAW